MNSGKRIGREFRIFFGCLISALLLNVYAIARYHTPWSELASTWTITLAITAVLYVVLAVLRILFAFVRWLLFRKTW